MHAHVISLLAVCVGTGLAIAQSPLTGSAAQKGVKWLTKFQNQYIKKSSISFLPQTV
jgi:hypothetical protein